MSAWDQERLHSFASADDLYISPFREDGTTYGTPTWIWSVVAGGDLCVRPYNGPGSRWYRAAMSQQGGRIRIAGTEYEVSFASADDSVLDAVDDAYRTKYAPQPVSGADAPAWAPLGDRPRRPHPIERHPAPQPPAWGLPGRLGAR
ncbi:DUF2255 family protein [Streptomyces sp. CB02400]|uniref:DUF2255 family protein n=1 Tax=Streptomyces sp. CB02400 TaxID=1703944 RepID=UPI001913128D|nr:DUF2255 family protein [Streptomyces sp. CB02400]